MKAIVALLIGLPAYIAQYLQWFGPLGARIALGFVFVTSGILKLAGASEKVGALQQLGVPFVGLASPIVSVATIVCGALVMAGLLTRIAAVLLCVGVLVRVVMIDLPSIQQPIVWYQWLNSFLGFTRVEYLALLAWLASAGPGPVSVDRAMSGTGLPPWLGRPPGARLAWLGPLVARVVVGYAFMWAGWGKLQDLPGFIQKFTAWGIPFPSIMTPFVSGTEFLGGILLMLGLLTRIVGVALLIVSLVAIVSAKLGSLDIGLGWYTWLAGFFNFDESLYMALCGWLAIAGAGVLSVDHLLLKKTGSGGETSEAQE